MNQIQKQVVMTKLAQVRLAVNYVLRTRAMQKQAEGPYKRVFYPNPYEGRPYNPLQRVAEPWAQAVENAINHATAKREDRAKYYLNLENPGIPRYKVEPSNATPGMEHIDRPEEGTYPRYPWQKPTQQEREWQQTVDAVKRTIKNRNVVGDSYEKSKPHHLDSNATKDENLAYMRQAYDGDPNRQGEWDNMENDYQRLYREPSGVFKSPVKPQ